MRKSDKLDELRLEVGMVADKVSTRSEFYSGIINTIGNLLPLDFGVAIYLCFDGVYSRFISYGEISEKKVVKYGDGMFSICSIRGKVIITTDEGKTIKAYAPFYNGQHLVGIMYVECKDQSYVVTDEDFIFLTEISRFVEVKGNQYSNSSIDNY